MSVALNHQTGVTLAEVGFLLIMFAGVWIVAASIPKLGISNTRTIVAGIALALAGHTSHHRHPLGSLRLSLAYEALSHQRVTSWRGKSAIRSR